VVNESLLPGVAQSDGGFSGVPLDRRLSMDAIFMAFAVLLAERSTCCRRSVGCVITDYAGLSVLAIGYNGNARGFANHCDREHEPGNCGCIHAELNALLKAPGLAPGKILYTTCAPCVACAKAIVNSQVARVVYRDGYRTDAGIELLQQAGVVLTRLP
jgi:dCMP deaminase